MCVFFINNIVKYTKISKLPLDFYITLWYYIYIENAPVHLCIIILSKERVDSMKITYTARKVTLKDNFKERVEKKLKKYDRIFSENAEANVKVTVYTNRQTVEITINDNGMIYRVEDTKAEMNEALDVNMDKLARQIRKNKTRLAKRLRETAFDEPIVDEDTDEEEAEVTYELFRTKKVSLKPMSPDEAILRMNMVDHKFFMFLNSDTDKVSVVYIRDNGDYGMLESELDD